MDGILPVAMAISDHEGQFLRFMALPGRGQKAAAPGVFVLAYNLREDERLAPADSAMLEELLAWFRKNLKVPPRFNRGGGKGWYRRGTQGVSWFKPSASEHIARVRELVALLARYDLPVLQISAVKIGYVVYEDDFQIVAEPFADVR
jgi:hypothetical protein